MPLIFSTIADPDWVQLCNSTNKSAYLHNYIKEYTNNGSVSIVIERDYIDKDFLIDFAYYYSRCFEDLKKKVTRVHFFSLEQGELETLFNQVIDNPQADNSKDVQAISDSYIGFTTIKPISERSMGRTIFKPYKSLDDNGNIRHFQVYNTYTVNIAGIELVIDALPFQEQDHNVAACATTAIWVALHGLKRVFGYGAYYSQYELTNMAFDAFGNMGSRKFPNEGLHDFQILNLISKIGYDTTYYNLSGRDNWFIDNLIKSHIDFGIPLLGFLTIKGIKDDGHLVTISGYKTKKDTLQLIELYVHDDQIGFYSKVEFRNDDRSNWKNEWITKFNRKEVILDSIVAPVYHKIRVPFNSVLSYLEQSFPMVDRDNLSIHLQTVAMFRKLLKENHALIKDNITMSVDNEEKTICSRDAVSAMLPKYLWVTRIEYNGYIVFIAFDATSYTLSPVMKFYHVLIQ